MPNTNSQNVSCSKDQEPTHFAFIDLGGANVRFGVLKKDDFLARVANNSYGLYFIFNGRLINKCYSEINEIEACFSLKQGRRVIGTKLGNVPWEICFGQFV